MSDKTFVSISNADIYDLIKEVKKTTDENNEHAKYTNGKIAEALLKIAEVKKKSFGCWVADHPLKTTGILIAFFGTVISDFRHPIIDTLKGLFLM
jgi:hypothetical protein